MKFLALIAKCLLCIAMYIVIIVSFLGFWMRDANEKPYISPADRVFIELRSGK